MFFKMFMIVKKVMQREIQTRRERKATKKILKQLGRELQIMDRGCCLAKSGRLPIGGPYG